MKIPLFIAHGQELANFLLMVAVVLYALPIVACVLAAKRKKVPAFVTGVLAALIICYVGIQVGTYRMPDILFLLIPLALAVIAIWIAAKIKPVSIEKKRNSFRFEVRQK